MGRLCQYLREEVLGNFRLSSHGYRIEWEEIGTGFFGKIKRATNMGNPIAVKIINRGYVDEVFADQYLHREIEILKLIDHKNIIKTLRIFEYPPIIYIFMELINGPNLRKYIEEKNHIEESEARFFFQQVVEAIVYLHGMEISHRDLKPENIMIHNEVEVKIIDFGFAIRLGTPGDMSLTIWGRSPYTAPELSESVYDPLAYDIWSLGGILFYMVTGTAPFKKSTDEEKLMEEQLSKSICYPEDFKLRSHLVNLLNKMMEPVADERLTIDQVNQTDWLQGKVLDGSFILEQRNKDQEET